MFGETAGEVEEQVERGRVRPVHIVDQQYYRLSVGDSLQQPGDGLEQPRPLEARSLSEVGGQREPGEEPAEVNETVH